MVHFKTVTCVVAIFIVMVKNTRVKKLFLKAPSKIYVLVFWVMAFRNLYVAVKDWTNMQP